MRLKKIIFSHIQSNKNLVIFKFSQVNHNFRDHNSGYSEAEHPRWGGIMCVESFRPIRAGEEIFTYYEERAPPNDFPWYFEYKRKFEEQEAAEERKRKDEEAKKSNKNKKSKRETTG